MPRNNRSRAGIDEAPDHKSPEDVAAAITPSSGLDFVVPTEFVELPSGGKFYPEDHPLHGQETIEIKYMTTKQEDILTSQTLLKKGLAINRMLQSILVTPGLDIKDLLIGDKNALTVAARVIGYGADYNAQMQCPSCNHVDKAAIDLTSSNNILDGTDWGELNIQAGDNGTFIITLPKTNVEMEVRLMTGHDEARITAQIQKQKKHNLRQSTLSDQMKLVTVSLNGVTDRAQISNFISNMPALDARYFRKAYQRVTPSVSLKHDYTCPQCDYEADLEVPLQAEFFWPQS